MPPQIGLPHDSLAYFARGAISTEDRRGRITAGFLTVAVHLAVVAGLLSGFRNVPLLAEQPAVMVDILKSKPRPPAEVMLVPKLIAVPVTDVSPPQFVIALKPAPIANQAATPSPQPKAAPPRMVRVDPAYLALIQAHLARNNIYPPEAIARHVEGVVYLHFILDATDHVLFSEITKSSGSGLLDAQVLALIQKAQPLPPIPANLNADRINLQVPIIFKLSR